MNVAVGLSVRVMSSDGLHVTHHITDSVGASEEDVEVEGGGGENARAECVFSVDQPSLTWLVR